jgi:hypothetical protein
MTDGSLSPLSLGKYAALVCVMAVSSVFSIAGSGTIVRIAHMKLSSTYQRFLFMLSLSDILNSLFLLLHPFLVPKDSSYYWAVGNESTCTVMGFFFIFGALLVSLYSCFLAVYFLFSIQSSSKNQKEPEDVIGCHERLTHTSCWAIPIAVGATAAGMKSLGFDAGIDLCVITSDQEIMVYVFQALVLLAAFVNIVATMAISLNVRATINNGKEPGFDAGSISDETVQRLRAVSSQAVLYTLAYLFSFTWAAVALTISTSSSNAYYSLQFLAYFLYPIQGVLNCCIYLRPRYQMLNVMYPNDSYFVVFRMAASKAGDPEEIENVRARIYGSDYESPSEASSQHSLDSDMPAEVQFDKDRPLSVTSLVSCPDDHEDPVYGDAVADDDADAAAETKSLDVSFDFISSM